MANTRFRQLLSAAAAVLAATVMLVTPGRALAAYPGHAGSLVYLDGYSDTDLLNNGAFTQDWYLTEARAPGTGSGRLLSCAGGDQGFAGSGDQFCAESGPSFSPDGSTLVLGGFEAFNGGLTVPDQAGCPTCQGLILAGATGGEPRLVPTGLLTAQEPAFMPDDATIVFAGQVSERSKLQLYLVSTSGTGLVQLTTRGGSEPAPCPSGAILYVHAGNIFLLSANGRRSRQLTTAGGTVPDCSRDSRTLVFLRKQTLYTMSVAGGNVRRLGPAGLAAGGRPALSPAGGEVAYVIAQPCSTKGCRQQDHEDQCTQINYKLDVLDLKGVLKTSYPVGSNDCTSDGDLGGDEPGAVAWQPLGYP